MQNPTWLKSLSAGMTVGAMIISFASTPAAAAEEDPNTGALSFTFNNDLTHAYFFRGILQERDNFIWQPSLDLSLNVYSCEDGALRSADVGFGTWASIHEQETGASGNGPDAMYETDFYPSLSLTWGGGLTTSFTYYFYTSPNNAFDTVQEAVVSASFDDSEYLNEFALNPSVDFVFETDNSRFGAGSGRGNMVEFGIRPGATFITDADTGECYPITLAFPAKLGLSMGSYYNDGPAPGENDTFGYASLGANVAVALGFIPKNYGNWSAGVGLDVYFLNDALENVNRDEFTPLGSSDPISPVGTFNLTMTY